MMPRSKTNPETFTAGKLPSIYHNDIEYYVDGRLQECRNANNFNNKLDTDFVWEELNLEDQNIIIFEYYGIPNN